VGLKITLKRLQIIDENKNNLWKLEKQKSIKDPRFFLGS
jgi:hypothetical protein